MPILLVPVLLPIAFAAFVVGLWMIVMQVLRPVLSPVSLFQSHPSTGFTAFNPRRYMPAVIAGTMQISWSGFMPSLPDWDQ